mmetsp:Transcript_2933/g.6956  ORF Transcript_2933/g.6956 Transcript_2933/m.6956 type:complete len:254 (-) Transcript_2933:558-1319(-)
MRAMIVLLPLPDSPTKATFWPAWMEKLALLSTVISGRAGYANRTSANTMESISTTSSPVSSPAPCSTLGLSLMTSKNEAPAMHAPRRDWAGSPSWPRANPAMSTQKNTENTSPPWRMRASKTPKKPSSISRAPNQKATPYIASITAKVYPIPSPIWNCAATPPFLAGPNNAVYRSNSLRSVPKDTTVRIANNTSSATAPAWLYQDWVSPWESFIALPMIAAPTPMNGKQRSMQMAIRQPRTKPKIRPVTHMLE